jgi:hypothetical protein
MLSLSIMCSNSGCVAAVAAGMADALTFAVHCFVLQAASHRHHVR